MIDPATEEPGPSTATMEPIDRPAEHETEPVPPTPAPIAQPTTTAPIRPQDVPVLPATPLLNYAVPGHAKSPAPKPTTPVVTKARPATSEAKGKKKNEKAPAVATPAPTMAAVAKAPPPSSPTPTLAKAATKEPATKKAKPPTLPPLSAVIAAATAEPSPTSVKSEATASPKAIKLPAINQTNEQTTPSTSVPPTPLTTAPVPAQRHRTMRIVSSSSTPTTRDASKEKENLKDKEKEKDVKALPDMHPLSTAATATKQGTRPATPASELISDTASTTSSKRGSISSPMVRSDSMASSNITTAGKAKSKSALKKERQALNKAEEKEKEKEPVPTQSPTVEDHAPVATRARKKDKKGKAPVYAVNKGKQPATAPASPKPSTPVSAHAVLESDPRDDGSSRAGSVSVPAHEENQREQVQEGEQEQNENGTGTESAQETVLDFDPAEIIRSLHISGEVNFRELEMLKPVVGLQHRYDITQQELEEFERRMEMANMAAASVGDGDDPQISVEITTSATGESSASVTAGASSTSRVIVTPGGVVLKGLTPEQEAKFLKLEERTARAGGPIKAPDFTLPKRDASTLAGTLATKAASLADLSLEETLAYLNQLNQFLEFSPETAAAAAAAASQLAQAHSQFTAGKVNTAPPPTIQPLAAGSSKSAGGSSNKKGKAPATDAGPPPSPINPASVASAAVAAAAGSLEQMLMMGFHGAFGGDKAPEIKMSVEELEKELIASRKNTETLEKRLNNLVKRNQRLIFGALESVPK
ncbi:hypothetical protein TWF696_004094 [Orbilia brochopaga]|uniref:Uncharacterized protein n=1 Tax=Orbilia brochopaga TaxID=3140254 RepID=A0AAV9V577_9PEZI